MAKSRRVGWGTRWACAVTQVNRKLSVTTDERLSGSLSIDWNYREISEERIGVFARAC